MEFKNGGKPIAGPSSGVNSVDSTEIDLYGELATFIDLSPEDRQRAVAAAAAQSNIAEEKITSSPAVEAAVETVEAAVVETPAIEATVVETPVVEAAAAAAPMIEAAVVEAATRLSKAPDRFRGATAELPDLTRPSGPLAGLFLRPEPTFAGALTRGVCLACGAESRADDVFCMTCGAFIDEVDSSPQEPNCADCGERIVPDEIFCPACGAALALA